MDEFTKNLIDLNKTIASTLRTQADMIMCLKKAVESLGALTLCNQVVLNHLMEDAGEGLNVENAKELVLKAAAALREVEELRQLHDETGLNA